MRNPTTADFETEPQKFLSRSDWTLAARGAARMKLHQKWHGFLMIKLAVLAAIDKAEQRTAELRRMVSLRSVFL